MADLSLLVRSLDQYLVELDRHRAKVDSEHRALQQSLQRLSTVYDGAAARDFKAHWANTQQRLDQYVEGTRGIRDLLQARVDSLRTADRPGGL